MPKPMTLVLWGSIISIAGALIGGTIVAVGKYRQDIASSKKSDTILSNTEKSIGIGEVTKEGVEELKSQKAKLQTQVIELLSIQGELKLGQETLNKKLDPFISYAHTMYPNVDTDQALSNLKNLLEEQNKKLDQTNKNVKKIEADVTSEKTRSKPSLKLKTWSIKNEKVTRVSKKIFNSRDFFDVKEKFNLDYLIFNQIEFTYRTEININEFLFLLNKNDVIYSLLTIKNGAIQNQGVSSSDGKKGFILTKPQNGDYILHIYSKTNLETVNQLLLLTNN